MIFCYSVPAIDQHVSCTSFLCGACIQSMFIKPSISCTYYFGICLKIPTTLNTSHFFMQKIVAPPSVVTSRCLAEKKGPLYMQRERPRAHFLGPPTYIQRGCIRLKDVCGGELKGRPLCKGRQGLLWRGARTLPCAQHTLQPSAQKRGRQRVCFAVVFVCGLQWLLLLYGKKTARECVSREGSFLVGICMQSTIEGIVKVCGVTSVEILLFVAKNKFNQ